jgi:hypothetical protein
MLLSVTLCYTGKGKDKGNWRLSAYTIKYCDQVCNSLYPKIEKFKNNIFEKFRLDIVSCKISYLSLSSLCYIYI